MRFVIGRDGHVSSARTNGLDHAPELARCLTTKLYALSFTPPQGGVVNVLYPLTLKPRRVAEPTPLKLETRLVATRDPLRPVGH